MAGWQKLLGDYELNITATGIEGTIAFAEIAAGTSSLPEVGVTTFSGDYPLCICRNIKITYTHFSGGAKQRMAVCTFSTRESGAAAHNIPVDLEKRTYQGGGEIIAVPHPKGWVWNSSNNPIEGDQDLFVKNTMGSFTRPIVLTSDNAKDAWCSDIETNYLGRINSTEFEGHRIGSVLFDTYGGGTQTNKDGEKEWVFECMFLWRTVSGLGGVTADPAGVVTQNDWQYLLNRLTGKWERPKLGDNFLYSTANLNLIFS